MTKFLIAVGVLALPAGCGPPKSANDTASTPPISLNLAPCGFAEASSGTIDVSERADVFHDGVYARVDALFLEAPSLSFQSISREENACRLYEFAPGTCDQTCAGGEVCTADSVCAAFPGSVGAGALTFLGLATPLSLAAASYSPGTYTGPGDLPAELFAPGDTVGARWSGDEIAAMDLGATGVATMDTDLLTAGFSMNDGEDAQFSWTPGPNPAACVQIVLNGFNITHGGTLNAVIVCEGTDTGSLVVPQQIVEGFPYGNTPELTEGFDWPHSAITRYTRSRGDTAFGPVDLLVRSTTYFLLGHPDPAGTTP